jgi:hypothetical protein
MYNKLKRHNNYRLHNELKYVYYKACGRIYAGKNGVRILVNVNWILDKPSYRSVHVTQADPEAS